MPMRPPAYEWLLASASELDRFIATVQGLAAELGAEVERAASGDGGCLATLVLSPDRLTAALRDRKLSDDELDPPEHDKYQLVLSWIASDEEYPAPRLVVDPEAGDNWAAWMLAGPLGDRVAEQLGGNEITGDPAPWLAHELARVERISTTKLPFLAVRSAPLFPGHECVLDIGRADSLATLQGMLDARRVELVACLQRDPSAEQPAELGDFFPIAIAMRVLRILKQGDRVSRLLIAKAVSRVRVLRLDAATHEVELEIADERDDRSIEVADLRRVARFDPLIAASAGVSRVAATETMPPGQLCDFIARHGGERPAYATVLQALEVDDRVRVTRQLFDQLHAR
jgi:hypothetical protein